MSITLTDLRVIISTYASKHPWSWTGCYLTWREGINPRRRPERTKTSLPSKKLASMDTRWSGSRFRGSSVAYCLLLPTLKIDEIHTSSTSTYQFALEALIRLGQELSERGRLNRDLNHELILEPDWSYSIVPWGDRGLCTLHGFTASSGSYWHY